MGKTSLHQPNQGTVPVNFCITFGNLTPTCTSAVCERDKVEMKVETETVLHHPCLYRFEPLILVGVVHSVSDRTLTQNG